MLKLGTPIDQIPRIQRPYQKRLKKLGIHTLKDLFTHIPSRYHDFSRVLPIRDLHIGETVTIQGRVENIINKRTFRKRMILTEAVVEDATGQVKAVWFNQPFLVRNIRKGDLVSLAGKVEFAYDNLLLSNPAYEVMRESGELRHTGGLIPVYPETAGITSRWFRYIIKTLIFKVAFDEFIPPHILRLYNLLSIKEAIEKVHAPKTKEDYQKARERLSFEELFLLGLFVLQKRLKIKRGTALPASINVPLLKAFVRSLPFLLTNAQRRAAWEILQDTSKNTPMNRLLEGDVGSGKTIVATIAALHSSNAGYQTAFMAPTEILAEQHFKELSKILVNENIVIGLLTGGGTKINTRGKKTTSRKELLRRLQNGDIDILIGTHALIQDSLAFRRLALVVVDEQHRFGVEQRAQLTRRSATLPHLLSMTATPIPRTLALTLYGDLDISLLDEMPSGRQKITTEIVPPAKREDAYRFIAQEIKNGHQVFVICPLIEESEKLEIRAATKEYERLSREVFPQITIALLHGKIKPKEKERIMADFKNKKVDILVSTSVVEVGIDIPNATVMLIEGAERFGLAQLHQFRGRVGRGKHQSYCLLCTDSPTQKTHARLKALIETKNGFELAEKDLKIRGPGEFFGTRQSGLPDIAMRALGDIKLIRKTREAASNLLDKDPELTTHPLLRKKLKEFKKTIHLE